MTLRARPPSAAGRAVALLPLLVVIATACGDSQGNLDQARSAAVRALERVERLEARLQAVDRELESVSNQSVRASRAGQRLRDRLTATGQRLTAALTGIRESIGALTATAESTMGDASSALTEARRAARDLAILQQRYDYHLRRYHGGG
jgi:chromosome segregation ATPase